MSQLLIIIVYKYILHSLAMSGCSPQEVLG